MTKVKICGITNIEDALLSVKFGADALGFNFYQRSPRYISPEKAREIIKQLPPEILKVGVFVNESLEKIAGIAAIANLDALQLHGEETPKLARELKTKTNLEIIKAFRVAPGFKAEDVLLYETDAILLDAYSPKEQGGTGETFDWEIAKKVQEIFPKMYLAGGLSHENIRQAVIDTNAFAVDACSRIEAAKGEKDKVKLINLITKAKKYIGKPPFRSIYSFLDVLHLRLPMYVGRKSLSALHLFLSGFNTALHIAESDFNTGKFFSEFQQYVMDYYKDDRMAFHWSGILLENSNGDEEKAVDTFFALLEEFKLEKEGLNNE